MSRGVCDMRFHHLLFVIVMMPLNYMLRKCTGGDKFTKSQEKINLLMLAKNKKRFEDSDANNKNIQPGYRDGIWHRKMCQALYVKRKKINNRRKRTAKSRKYHIVWREGKLQILGNIRSRYYQSSKDEKKKKRVP